MNPFALSFTHTTNLSRDNEIKIKLSPSAGSAR